MRAFIDTSAMIKKYINEAGADEFDQFLSSVTQIVVAPTYLLEAHATIERRLREKLILSQEMPSLRKEINTDNSSYEQIVFSQRLHETALYLIASYPITTLDSIQLASACIAEPDIFVTSDKQLYKYAKHELKKVKLI